MGTSSKSTKPGIKIAGEHTDLEWFGLEKKLTATPTNQALWKRAYRDFYYARIYTRYLKPIRAIEQDGDQLGEGFAIAALFCSLVEFLEACEKGLRYKRDNPDPAQFEYGDSRQKFENFLKRKPFDTLVPSHLVHRFYVDVRCGLLHEAQTKGVWVLSAKRSRGVLLDEQPGTRIRLFRKELPRAFRAYFKDYRQRLLTEPAVQQAFKRKFGFLCTP